MSLTEPDVDYHRRKRKPKPVAVECRFRDYYPPKWREWRHWKSYRNLEVAETAVKLLTRKSFRSGREWIEFRLKPEGE